MEKAQVWVSTILYTVISLAIIGLLLAVIQPRIAQLRDSIVIDQTKSSLSSIDETMMNVQGAPGMKLMTQMQLGKGQLILSGISNTIKWTYDTNYQYSEINETIPGTISELTQKLGGAYRLTLLLNYSHLNLTFNGADQDKVIQAAPNPYKIWFENKGNSIDITLG